MLAVRGLPGGGCGVSVAGPGNASDSVFGNRLEVSGSLPATNSGSAECSASSLLLVDVQWHIYTTVTSQKKSMPVGTRIKRRVFMLRAVLMRLKFVESV